ncbi:MAG: glutathione binding-like protein [Bdellovibrionota bacterium]
MKLIYAKGACSLSVHILLRELDLPFEAIRVSLEDKRVLDSYNHKSYVPALILEDGSLLTEAISILQFLSDSSGGLFMPYGSFPRAKCTEWLTYISTELHKGMAPLFHQEGLKPEYLKEVQDKIHLRLQFMDDALSESEYLLTELSIADFYAVAILRILEHVEVKLDGYHWISEYKKRLEQRPIIADVLDSEEKAEIATKINPEPGNLVTRKPIRSRSELDRFS